MTPKENTYRVLSQLKMTMFSEKVIESTLPYEVLNLIQASLPESMGWRTFRNIKDTLESI